MKKLHWKAPLRGRLGEQVMSWSPIRFTLLVLLCFNSITTATLYSQDVGCIGDINVTLDENCSSHILPETVLTGDYAFADSIAIMINGENTDSLFGCGIHAYSVELFTNDEVVFTCWGEVLAEDKTPPVLICPEDTGDAVLLDDMQVLTGQLIEGDSPTFDPSSYSCFTDVSPPLEDGEYYYSVHYFDITTTDIFTFIAAAEYDGVMALYQDSFSPEEPCQNLIAHSNDTYIGSVDEFDPLVPILDPSFRLSLSLQINRTYALVWTSKTPLQEGDYGISIFTDGNGRLANLSKTQVQLAAELICLDIDEVTLGSTYTFSLHPDGSLILDYSDPFRIPEDVRTILDFTGFPEVSDNCSSMLMTIYDEVEEEGDCSSWVITRHFSVQDRYLSDCEDPPLVSVCSQTITVRKPTLEDIVFPPLSTTVECDEGFPTDGEVGGPEDNPSPAYTGLPYLDAGLNFYNLEQSACNIGASYSDEPRITSCSGSYYFRREWTIVDWCNPDDNIVVNQLIRVGDYTGPIIDFVIPDHNENGLPDDPLKYSTAPNNCLAYADLSLPMMSDGNGCSGIGSSLAQIYTADGDFVWLGTLPEVVPLELGDYVLTFCAVDQCGNETCVEELIEVRDGIAPIAVCTDEIIVSIGGGDSQNGDFGTATVTAEDLDEGSNDHCSDVNIAIRREDEINWSDEVLFDCTDIGDTVKIYLQVLDSMLNENFCWINVVPEDKLNPVCFAPEDATLSCTDLPLTFPGDIQEAYDTDFQSTSTMMSDLFGGPTGTDNCIVDTVVERSPNIQINECGWGMITRRFEAWQWRPAGDLNGNGEIEINEVYRSNNSCSQTITVTETHDFTIDFPEDAAEDCGQADPPTIITSTRGCDVLSVNISDPVVFEATGDECYKYAITYDVINWCLWDGEYDGYVLDRITEDDGEDLPTDRAVEGNERPVIHYDDSGLLIDRDHDDREGDSEILDASPLLPNYGRYIYTQFVKIYDNSAPEIEVMPFGGPTPSCPSLMPGQFGDLFGSCEAAVEIDFSVSDDCELFDIDGNLVISIVSAELDAFAVDSNGDGDINANEFISDEDIIDLIIDNGDGTYQLAGNFPVIPSAAGDNIYHAARILLEDGCGNQTSVYLVFDVVDCKAPAPICINGLTVTLMPQAEGGCAMAVWASDFIGSPVYDCTGEGSEQNEEGQTAVTSYAIYRGLEVEGTPDFVPSPEDTGVVLNESDDPTTVLYVYAFDAEGNYDFCETYILVQSHSDCSDNGSGTIAGFIATEELEAIPEVEVSVSGDEPQMVMTNELGMYNFTDISIGADVSILPYLNSNPLNGVTTFDLILISKHILGVDPLGSPYRMIAADVNQSNTISTLDLIQIRKLILNIDTEFSNNTSWRFIAAEYDFPAPTNPWIEVFPELISINNITEEVIADFVGVKIGDVNSSASFDTQSGDDRFGSSPYKLLLPEQQLKAGETYEIPFSSQAGLDLEGFQGSLQFLNAEILGVEYGVLGEHNFGQKSILEGFLIMSWNSEPPAILNNQEHLFAVRIRPNKDVKLSEVVWLSSRLTPSEAYVDGGIQALSLSFESKGKEALNAFELMQNTPNPFSGETRITFTLPTNGEVLFQLDQLTGQNIAQFVIDGKAGTNTVNLRPTQFVGHTGILTYSITFDKEKQTKKLVRLP